MKFHQIIHRILLMIGIALGIVTTGATANAKAQQVNTNNAQNNNSSKNINHSQFSTNASKLVNRLESSPVVNEYNYGSMGATSSSTANVSSSYSYANSSADQVSSPASESNSKFSGHVNRSNNDIKYPSLSKFSFNTKLNHVYNNILLNSELKARQNLENSKNKINLNQSAHVAYHHHVHSWFNDGLSAQNLRARSWVSWHESNHRWRVLSYGGICVGYFQLNPRYLGYRNGHVDLRPEHQVKVADQYVQKRYGSWVNAKRFWVFHHWY